MYTLSAADASVAAFLEHQAYAPLQEIASATKLHTHTVAYCREKLLRRKVLGPLRATINKYRLGLHNLHVMFSTVTSKARHQSAIVEWLARSPYVGWIAEVGGSYQYAINVRTSHRYEEALFMKEFGSAFPQSIRSQAIAIITAQYSFGRRFIGPSRLKRRIISHALVKEPRREVDDLDSKILTGLATLEFSSERELSSQLKVPAATVRRRIDQLTSDGIIDGYYHHIDTALLGYQHYKLQVVASSLNVGISALLMQFALHQDHVVHLIEAIGSWHAELQVEVRDAHHAVQIANELRIALGADAESITVIPVLRIISAAPFLKLNDKS